jgi:hypothetical protein
MGSRGSLRVVLHREQGQLPMPHALDGPVVEVEVSDLETRRARNPIRIANYSEAMVLCRDEQLAKASPMSWWPRQMPNVGRPAPASSRTAPSA